MNKEASFGDRDPYGPAEYESSPSLPKRQDSPVQPAVMFDVPLDFDELDPRESDGHPTKGPGIRQLRRSMRFAKVVCLVASAFLVAILVLVIPKSGSKGTSGNAGQLPASSPQVNLDIEAEASKPRPACHDRFIECVGDRLSHGELLETGDAICSADIHYEMGMDVNGSLVWQNCTNSSDYVRLYEGKTGYSFHVDKNGRFIVRDEFGKNKKIWDCNEEVKGTRKCYETGSGRRLDCPFLHIHRLKGRVVLNWEDSEEGWHQRSITRLYDFDSNGI